VTALIGFLALLLWLLAVGALLDIRKSLREISSMMKADRPARTKDVAIKSLP
jgi:hypothetical protein